MKKIIWSIPLALFAISCSVEEPIILETCEPERVFARIESADESETRVYADENLKVLWDADDRISLFNKYTYNKQYRFAGETGQNSGEFEEVNSGAVITGNALDYVYAVYPYQAGTKISNDGVITLALPSEQIYSRDGSFGKGANTMVSATTNTELLFKNLCGYIVLKLYGEDVSVSSITLTGKNDEPLAGNVNVTAAVGENPSFAFSGTGSTSLTLTCPTPVTLGTTAEEATTFWFVVPPTTFSNGFTITVTDENGGTFEKSSSSKTVVSRNSTFRMKPLSVEITEPVAIPNYLSFMALEEGSTISFSPGGNRPTIEYSFDGRSWTNWDFSPITLGLNEKVYMRGNNIYRFGQDELGNRIINTFKMTGVISSEGNIMSILYGDDFDNKTAIPSPYCFDELFSQCSSLITPPELPATSLTSNCYYEMFMGCSSLKTAPVLPATELAYACYYEMFNGCSSLTEAPSLPATTLVHSCYRSMFMNCTSLLEAPELPATTLAEGCYFYMFYNCTSLKEAPELPATTLATICYKNMFEGCTSLTKAPHSLPATSLERMCYQYMFKDCHSLSSPPELPATSLADYCYNDMFQNCTSLSSCPTLPATKMAFGCYWNMFSGCSSLTACPALPAKDLDIRCYSGMFQNCTSLVEGPSELPAKTLKNYCYYSMFAGCIKLTAPPELPASSLADYCYSNMFQNCSSIKRTPQLLATTLAERCYMYMFTNCSSLTEASALPATELKNYCYLAMFRGCTALINAPTLPATSLTTSCYSSMFDNCSNLAYIKMMATDISASNCLSNWVYGVANHGTFVKNAAAEWEVFGDNGIPNGWDVNVSVSTAML